MLCPERATPTSGEFPRSPQGTRTTVDPPEGGTMRGDPMNDPRTEHERETLLEEGVRALDHTADVGLEVHAPSLETLFDRAARGLGALIRGDDVARAESATAAAARAGGRSAQDSPPGERMAERVAVEAPDAGALLVAWLRELLWLFESKRLAYEGARFETLTETSLVAAVRATAETRTPVREIKGVTYHGLDVGSSGDGWHARVIFDV
jgi:SHS2 domain-containing protein